MTREEIELLSRISKRLVEEKDPDRFTNFVRELDDLLQKDQNSREQNGKLTPRNTAPPHAEETLSASLSGPNGRVPVSSVRNKNTRAEERIAVGQRCRLAAIRDYRLTTRFWLFGTAKRHPGTSGALRQV